MKPSRFRNVALLGVFCTIAAPAPAVDIDTVSVGNPGNAGELSGEGAGGYGPNCICGAVDYEYFIGTFEVTAGQYCEFLNAVAATDTYGLYNEAMWTSSAGCKIQQNGTSGSYTYTVAGDWAERPVNFVSWGDAARFCNWLHNGQPTGPQDPTTTEDGSYDLDGATTNVDLLAVTREPDATWVIPTEDEWYKAAYHKNDGASPNYFDYPTGTDTTPSNDLVDPDPGNNANFYQDGYTIGGPYYRTEVGAFENSQSPYGTFDQGGNVLEWNEAILDDDPFPYDRGVRGGYSSGYDFFLHAAHRGGNEPTAEFLGVGFRVAYVGETVTLTLTTVNESWGEVDVEPNLPEYFQGTPVTLTATPVEGKEFRHWEIYEDPNFIGDANYAVIDANLATTILMDQDKGVTAVFKCGGGVAPFLPMLGAVLSLSVVLRRIC